MAAMTSVARNGSSKRASVDERVVAAQVSRPVRANRQCVGRTEREPPDPVSGTGWRVRSAVAESRNAHACLSVYGPVGEFAPSTSPGSTVCHAAVRPAGPFRRPKAKAIGCV